ncbi:MAG TPA: NAD(+) diphosphatase [Steroidobacteraceae bacterium]|nr:NAD(+) diphosphatase [Steroidobacteraceae bacterium]
MGERLERLNVFAGTYLDRQAHLREREDWLARVRSDPATVVVPVWQNRNLFHRGEQLRAVLLHEAQELLCSADPMRTTLLGQFRGAPCVLVELEGEAAPVLAPDCEFHELRFYGSLLPADEAGLLAYARALVLWRSRHRYCGQCGSPNLSTKGGHVLLCSNPACGQEQFPRIDPAIIVLITDGERALLGRQASWPEGRYSTIAGFVEPGESLEDAVRREVKEETDVDVFDIDYHSSQPWPFPSSLMLGFVARAQAGAACRCSSELEDARWYSRADVANGLPALPSSLSISFRLIEDWYNSGSQLALRDTPGARLWEIKRP